MSLCQSIVKSLSGTCCLAVIFSDVSVLSGLFMGRPIVVATKLDDPIMSAIFSNLMVTVAFFDIMTQAVGLIVALCLEMKWMLRLYMVLIVTFLIIRCSTVLKQPVIGIRTAPFLGRTWSYQNTPYDQMNQDIKRYHVRLPSQVRDSVLYHFEKTLHCCGVNGPADYTLTKSAACFKNERPPAKPASSSGNHTAANDTSRMSVSRQEPPGGGGGGDGSEFGHQGGAVDGVRAVAVNSDLGISSGPPYKDGCLQRVMNVWEGAKITFDSTVSAIFWTMLTAMFTVAWCEFWGDGLLTGLTCPIDNKHK